MAVVILQVKKTLNYLLIDLIVEGVHEKLVVATWTLGNLNIGL